MIHSVWLHGLHALRKGNWERKSPMQIGNPPRCNADPHWCPHAHAEGPCLHYTCNNASEAPWDSPHHRHISQPLCSACGRRPCMAPRPESPKKGKQGCKTNAVVSRKRASPHACAVDHRHKCPPPALSDGRQQHDALHPAMSQGGAEPRTSETNAHGLHIGLWTVTLLRCKHRTRTDCR